MSAEQERHLFAASDGNLSIAVASDGSVTSVDLPAWQRPILREPVPFMAVRESGNLHNSSHVERSKGNELTVSFENWPCKVGLRVEMARDRVSFEVIGVECLEPDELSLLNIPVTMDGLVGEHAGIVQEDHIAFGVLGLNWYTDARAEEEDGAVRLSASADCRSGLVGARFAVFACLRNECLPTVEQIQKLEPGLPYFTDDEGRWLRRSPDIGKPYIAMSHEGFSAEKALDYAVRGGFPILYLGAMTWTRVWGHFEIYREAFPGGEDELVELGRKALDKGVRLGFHTLSGAISASDRYVSPVPDTRLATIGSGKLLRPIEGGSSEIIVTEVSGDFCHKNKFYTTATEDTGFDTLLPGGAFRTGSEVFRCKSMKLDGNSVILGGCRRGEYGTAASRHEPGEEVSRLREAWAPGLFFPDVESSLLDEMAHRIAGVANSAGMGLSDFDGLEGLAHEGLYGCNRFLYEVSRRWKRPLMAGASMLSHYGFHVLTRHCWGEETYDVRGDMELRSRYDNLPIYESHLLKPGVGWQWFRCASTEGEATTVDEIEYLFAKAAGFGGPCALSTWIEALENHGLTDQLLRATSAWGRAIESGAFTENHKARMRAKGTDFHLEQTREDELLLTEQKWSRRQWFNLGGQSHLRFENPFHLQSPTLIVRCLSAFDKTNADNLSIPIRELQFEPETVCSNLTQTPANVHIAASGNGLRVSAIRGEHEMHIARSWSRPSQPLDVSKHRGLGLEVDGDGSGALLFVEVKDVPGMIRQYYWRMDFTGTRWLELPNGEVAIEQYYDHAPWNARWDHAVKWFDYTRIGSIAIGLTELKPDRPASCNVRSMQFLSEVSLPLDGLVVDSEYGSVSIPATISPDQYLRIESDGSAAVYDRDWHCLAELPDPVHLPVVSPGTSAWAIKSASGANSWINVRTCSADKPQSIILS